MEIRCKECGGVIRIESRIGIEMYLKGVVIKCKRCLGENEYEGEKDNEGRGDS